MLSRTDFSHKITHVLWHMFNIIRLAHSLGENAMLPNTSSASGFQRNRGGPYYVPGLKGCKYLIVLLDHCPLPVASMWTVTQVQSSHPAQPGRFPRVLHCEIQALFFVGVDSVFVVFSAFYAWTYYKKHLRRRRKDSDRRLMTWLF